MLLDHSSAGQASSALSALPPALVMLIAGGLLALFVLVAGGFAFLRQKIQSVAAQATSRERSAAALASELEAQALLVRQMSTDLEELRKRLSERMEPAQPAVPLWASDMPVNLNRRGQIIRLSRKGKSIPEIASDLNVAQGEVELLLKVHDLSQRKSEQGKS
jgi:DNA-binding NarL/FixJ family response regulator